MSCALALRIRQAFTKAPRPAPPPDLLLDDAAWHWPWPPPVSKRHPPHPGVRRSLESKARDEPTTRGWPLRTAIRVDVERSLVWGFVQPSLPVPSPGRPDSATLGAWERRHIRCDSELTSHDYNILGDMVGDIDFAVRLTFKIDE